MKKAPIFEMLVLYHCQKNLAANSNPEIPEGEENESYKGVLIASNGKTLVDKLIQDQVIFDENVKKYFSSVKSSEDFFKYIDKQKAKDGGHLYDNPNNRMTRVPEFNNSIAKLTDKEILDSLPKDFFSYNGKVEEPDIGTKTRMAIKLAKAYPNIDSYQIKRTAYGNIGMGKVTHFNSNGMYEEFFLLKDENSQGPFIDQENKIVGVYRSYEKQNGKLVRTQQCLVDINTLKEKVDSFYSKTEQKAA